MSHDSISALGSMEFSRYPNLEILYLDNNPIGNNIHPSAFNGTEIERVYLDGTGMTSIPSAIKVLSDAHLYLALLHNPGLGDNIKPTDFEGMNIYVLDLENTGMTSIPTALLNLNNSLEALLLWDNPLVDVSVLPQLMAASNTLTYIDITATTLAIFPEYEVAMAMCRPDAPSYDIYIYDVSVNHWFDIFLAKTMQ